MITIYLNESIDEPERRESIYGGDFHLITGHPASLAIVEFARELIADAFGDLDPQRAQFEIDREAFIERVSPLKSRFVNDDRTKELTRDLVIAMGCDPEDTYFDLPRLRVIPSEGFLTTGVSYNYKAHRDSWYAHPTALVNYWVPVFDATGDNVMSMYVGYFDKPVKNGSSGFDYDTWVAESRFAASEQVGKEERPHPLPPGADRRHERDPDRRARRRHHDVLDVSPPRLGAEHVRRDEVQLRPPHDLDERLPERARPREHRHGGNRQHARRLRPRLGSRTCGGGCGLSESCVSVARSTGRRRRGRAAEPGAARPPAHPRRAAS